MQNPYDQLAKQIGEEALAPFGTTVVHDEIPPETQYADLRHEPDPARAADRQQLGLLGQIASILCLIEVYSDTPNGDEFRACLSKHIAFWRQRTRKARGENREQGPDPWTPEVSVDPFLWVLTAGVPKTLLTELKLEAASGWPAGVYLFGGNVLRVGIIVASKLPRDRSTLLVRLMAAGSRLDSMMGELRALSPDARERVVAEPIRLRLQHALDQQPSLSSKQQEMKMALYKSFEEIRAEGSAQGSAKALLIMLQGRGISVPDAARERILAERNPEQLTRWLERAGVVTSIDDLLGDVR
jgi:hypothetical protein